MELLSYLAFFMFGCLAGWVIDSLYRSVLDKRWVNAGYFWGPVCPIYGFGALILLILSESIFEKSILIKAVVYFVSLSAVEFVGGLFCVYVLKTRLWDYTNAPLNILGHIDLKHSTYWLLLAFVFEIAIWTPLHWMDTNLHYLSIPVGLTIFVTVIVLMVLAVGRKIVVERPKISARIVSRTPREVRRNLARVDDDYDRLMEKLDRKIVWPAERPVRYWFDDHEHYLQELHAQALEVEKEVSRVRNRVVTHHMERDLQAIKRDIRKQLADLRAARISLEGVSKRERLRAAKKNLDEGFKKFASHARSDVKWSLRAVNWNMYTRHRGRLFRPRAVPEQFPEWFKGWKGEWERLEKYGASKMPHSLDLRSRNLQHRKAMLYETEEQVPQLATPHDLRHKMPDDLQHLEQMQDETGKSSTSRLTGKSKTSQLTDTPEAYQLQSSKRKLKKGK